MEIGTKLSILADAAKYDASCASSGTTERTARKNGGVGSTTSMGICHSYAPDGRCISLLKILLTNFCIYDCLYCVNRLSSDVPRARFTVDEVVDLTLGFYRRNYIEGLFLSSGIIQNPDYTMEQLIAVAKSLRLTHQFQGYIHLKTIPDADPRLLEEAGRYADRLSINIELPLASSLQQLAPEKNHQAITHSMGQLKDYIDDSKQSRQQQKRLGSAPRGQGLVKKRHGRLRPYAPGGQSTQMIIGADAANDFQILTNSHHLYQGLGMRRVYYSAFSPIPDASRDLPPEAPPLLREHRLYQADWLLRFYQFDVDELLDTQAHTMLDLDIDPKLSWALRHRHWFPLDINRASRSELLRIPGLGPRNVSRILASRRFGRLRLADLKKMRLSLEKLKPFIITADYAPKIMDQDTDKLRQQLVVKSPESPQLALF